MGIFQRQDLQLGSTLDSIVGFVDTTAPAAAMESGAGHLADDLNNVRSMLSYFNDLQAGNWYDPITAPSTLEAGSIRAIQALNDALHLIEKKRVLRCVWNLHTITIAGVGDTFDILGAGELPSNTTAAVGAVTTLGTVVAAHSGVFGTASLDEVAGPTAIGPKNLVQIVDAVTRDPVLDAGDQIYGLLQGESGVTDGATITAVTTTRVQISFVKINGTGDDLIAISAGAMDGVSYDYCSVERVRLEDLGESDFLGGANVDVPAGATVTRQVAYDNQGTTPVDQTTNATLDLEGPGLEWQMRDDLEAILFRIIEGSAGGTSEVEIASAVDLFDVDAVVNDFSAGISARTGGTRPIDIGVNDGLIESTAGVLEVKSAGDLVLNDVNMVTEATWTGPGVKVSDTTAEVVAYETAFGGEVSLMNAVVQALEGSSRTRVNADITGGNHAAGTDINGPGTPHSTCTADLLPYDVIGIGSLEVFLNGELIDLTTHYVAGGTPSDGDLQFTFQLKGTGSKPDSLQVIQNGSN